MGMNWIAKLAAKAPVPIFIARGNDAPDETDKLHLNPNLSIVDTPRAASILLVAGTIPHALTAHLHRLHDQLPHPRATIFWHSSPTDQLSSALGVTHGDDLGSFLLQTRAALLTGERASEADVLPDEPANVWRGVGPHGQGGKGMMGGTPYGRPMAMTDGDMRDGLKLDAYTADFGPFLTMLPSGMILKITLQGDLFQKVAVVSPPYEDARQGREIRTLLKLLGLPTLANRLLIENAHCEAGFKRLVTLSGVRRAIPPDLGRTHDGSDVRSRFEHMLNDPSNPQNLHLMGLGLGDLLEGREWQEAMLILNSFDNTSLRKICANTPTDATDDMGDSSEQASGGHEGMDHSSHGGH